MRIGAAVEAEVAVIGAGVVGAAVGLELARRGVRLALLEAEPEPGLEASGTNSGILHTGFDSKPGELETRLILRAAALREPLLERLAVPVLRCGAEMRPLGDGDVEAIARIAAGARRNGVEVRTRGDGALEVPGEAVTDPVAFTLALVAAAEDHGAVVRMGARASAIERQADGLRVRSADGDETPARAVVNCAGLGAGEVARLAGDESFDVYPRKGEFLVFEPPADGSPDRILLPVPSAGTKGVLVFPTVDGKLVAGPTAVDQHDRADWSVRPQARAEILDKVAAMAPALAGVEPVFAYAGLRAAGRGVNYLIGHSAACPGLVNVAAIRSTGLTASIAIAEYVCGLVGELGIEVADRASLIGAPASPQRGAWWRRTAEHRAQ